MKTEKSETIHLIKHLTSTINGLNEGLLEERKREEFRKKTKIRFVDVKWLKHVTVMTGK